MSATNSQTPTPAPLASRPGSVTAEEWWVQHATLLAEKMRLGGVRMFRVELTPRGTYEFEVDPIESPNSGMNDGPSQYPVGSTPAKAEESQSAS